MTVVSSKTTAELHHLPPRSRNGGCPKCLARCLRCLEGSSFKLKCGRSYCPLDSDVEAGQCSILVKVEDDSRSTVLWSVILNTINPSPWIATMCSSEPHSSFHDALTMIGLVTSVTECNQGITQENPTHGVNLRKRNLTLSLCRKHSESNQSSRLSHLTSSRALCIGRV